MKKYYRNDGFFKDRRNGYNPQIGSEKPVSKTPMRSPHVAHESKHMSMRELDETHFAKLLGLSPLNTQVYRLSDDRVIFVMDHSINNPYLESNGVNAGRDSHDIYSIAAYEFRPSLDKNGNPRVDADGKYLHTQHTLASFKTEESKDGKSLVVYSGGFKDRKLKRIMLEAVENIAYGSYKHLQVIENYEKDDLELSPSPFKKPARSSELIARRIYEDLGYDYEIEEVGGLHTLEKTHLEKHKTTATFKDLYDDLKAKFGALNKLDNNNVDEK